MSPSVHIVGDIAGWDYLSCLVVQICTHMIGSLVSKLSSWNKFPKLVPGGELGKEATSQEHVKINVFTCILVEPSSMGATNQTL